MSPPKRIVRHRVKGMPALHKPAGYVDHPMGFPGAPMKHASLVAGLPTNHWPCDNAVPTKFRTSYPDVQMPPTESQMIQQRKQLAGTEK